MLNTTCQVDASGDVTTDHIGLYGRLRDLMVRPGGENVWLMMTPTTLPVDFLGILQLQVTHNEVRLTPIGISELSDKVPANDRDTLRLAYELVSSDPGGQGFTILYALGNVDPGENRMFVMQPQTDGSTLLAPTLIADLSNADVLFASMEVRIDDEPAIKALRQLYARRCDSCGDHSDCHGHVGHISNTPH